jgi:hypothetical protein
VLAVLILIRDVLVAAALAWVGVSLEARETPSCTTATCEQPSE